MKRNTGIKLAALVATLGMAAPLTGCSLIFGAINKAQLDAKQKEYDKKLAAATEKKDVEALQGMCQTKNYRDKIARRNKGRACKALMNIKLDELRNAQCGQAANVYENFKKNRYYGVYRAAKQVYFEGGVRVAKCKKWDYLFSHFLHSNTRMSQELLSKVEASGIPLEKEVISWIARQDRPFSFRSGYFASVNLTRWLQNKDKKYCSTFMKAIPKASKSAKRSMISYAAKNKCEGIVSLVTKQMSSDNGFLREQACHILGRMGDRSHLKKMNLLRFYDPAYVRRGKYVKYKVYYVRDACRAAVGKIRIRTE